MAPHRSTASDDERINQQLAQIEAQYDEEGVIRSDERLSEVFPDQFAAYCDHFIDFFPSLPYHIKTTYDTSSQYGGWVQKKSRKTGRPLRLIDTGKWLNRTSAVERHLDQQQWQWYHEFHDISFRPTEFFWLGLHMPKKTRFHAIDADNKRRIAWCGEGTVGDPLLPVMEMPLEHFAFLKSLYDAFPDRIWCITSETLGLDIIKRQSLQATSVVHDRTKRRLAQIAYGQTEVHPMSGRCKRRPFGEHYRTISSEGVLTTWQHQLDHYLNPGPTPSFRQIAVTLLDALEDQWGNWLSDKHHKRNRGIDVPAIVESQQEGARKIMEWLDDDCPPLTLAMSAGGVGLLNACPSSIRKSSPVVSTSTPHFDLSSLRGGNWAKRLEEIARNGLPAEDTVGPIVFEMAKWLWWVELFHVPEGERHGRVLELLTTFVTEKHNGFVSRWNNGQEGLVLSQISRCVDSAMQLNVSDRSSCLKTFDTLRLKRESGKYKRLIRLEPVLLGQEQTASDPASSSLLSTLFSVCGFEERLGEPLPVILIEWIDKKRGRTRIESYATRLVNLLFHAGQEDGFVRVERKELCTLALGYYDPTRFSRYNRILHSANIIDMDSYRAHTMYTGYRLTADARQVVGEARLQCGDAPRRGQTHTNLHVSSQGEV